MRFLELKEAATGVRFDHPVLDTLLLSAVVHPSFENHHLDTIAERLGVRVIGRHTALGDALVTGEVFLKLLPLLADRGILTWGRRWRRRARPTTRGSSIDRRPATMAEPDSALERRLAGEHRTLARPLRALVRRPPVVCGEATAVADALASCMRRGSAASW